MPNKSSSVMSNQTDVHVDLEKVVKKHLSTPYLKPFRHFSENLFQQLNKYRQEINLPVILDSGCGTGESTINLAKRHDDHLVIGIDKSANRLSKTINNLLLLHQDNYIIAQGDVIDIWRMIKNANWNIAKHYLLYPNPWPKKDQLKRRWHGHPVFPEMVTLCENIELRTNWKIYAEEFKNALELITDKNILIENIEADDFISPFGKKYFDSNHDLLCVYCD